MKFLGRPGIILTLAVFSVGCTSVPQQQPASTGTGKPPLELGRDLYYGKCTKCHAAEPVTNYAREQWMTDILPTMCKKTKLNAAESAAVAAFVKKVLADAGR